LEISAVKLPGNGWDKLIASWRTRSPRRPRSTSIEVDGLEGRVVLSHAGVAAAIAHHARAAQVHHASSTTSGTTATTSATTTTTSSDATTGVSGSCDGLGGVSDSQLTTDLTTLRTDLNAVRASSAVTDAQRYALRSDLRTIAQTGLTIDRTALSTVTDTLLTALANGTYDSDPNTAASIKSSFNALFTGSSVAQAQIDQTFTDFVAVARGLNINTAQLKKLATDRAAVQADLTRLGNTNSRLPGSNLDLVIGGGGGLGRHGR
jgi:hypothetical protein